MSETPIYDQMRRELAAARLPRRYVTGIDPAQNGAALSLAIEDAGRMWVIPEVRSFTIELSDFTAEAMRLIYGGEPEVKAEAQTSWGRAWSELLDEVANRRVL